MFIIEACLDVIHDIEGGTKHCLVGAEGSGSWHWHICVTESMHDSELSVHRMS